VTLNAHLERYRGVAWALFDFGFFALAGFVVNLSLARQLDPEAYGAFSTSLAVQVGLLAVQMALFTDPLLVFAAGKYASRPQGYLRAVLRAHFVVWSIVALVITGFAYLSGLVESPVLQLSLTSMALATPAVNLLHLVRRLCYARSAVNVAALMAASYLVLVAAALWVLARLGHVSPFTAYLSLAVISAGLSAVWLVRALQKGQDEPVLSQGEVLSAHVGYAGWGVAGALLAWVPIGIWYVLWPLVGAGAQALALSAELRAIVNFAQPALQVNSALGTVLTPRFTRELHVDAGYSPWKWSLLLACGSLLYVPLLVLTGPWLFEVVYRGTYVADRAALALIGLVPVCQGLISGLRAYCLARGLPEIPFQACAVAAVLSVVAGVPLCAHYGTLGAIGGMLTGYASIALFLAWRVSVEAKKSAR
jgi:O-antigen/teichoic acid export membrane protein